MSSTLGLSLTATDVALLTVAATTGSGVLAAAISVIVTRINGKFTEAQTEVSKQALFASLLEKRITWLCGIRQAVWDREKEVGVIDLGLSRDIERPEALFRVIEHQRDAEWLFGPDVACCVNELEKLLKSKTSLMIGLRSYTNRLSSEGSKSATISIMISKKLSELTYLCQPFLYVGDVKRPNCLLKELRPE